MSVPEPPHDDFAFRTHWIGLFSPRCRSNGKYAEGTFKTKPGDASAARAGPGSLILLSEDSTQRVEFNNANLFNKQVDAKSSRGGAETNRFDAKQLHHGLPVTYLSVTYKRCTFK